MQTAADAGGRGVLRDYPARPRPADRSPAT